MGVSEHKGPSYRTLNSRIPTIRTPEQDISDFRIPPFAKKGLVELRPESRVGANGPGLPEGAHRSNPKPQTLPLVSILVPFFGVTL